MIRSEKIRAPHIQVSARRLPAVRLCALCLEVQHSNKKNFETKLSQMSTDMLYC